MDNEITKAYQKFEHIGWSMLIAGVILLPVLLYLDFACFLMAYMGVFSIINPDPVYEISVVGTVISILCALYFLVATITSVYFIRNGYRIKNHQYSYKQLYDVFFRASLLSFSWPIIGIPFYLMCASAMDKWLPMCKKVRG